MKLIKLLLGALIFVPISVNAEDSSYAISGKLDALYGYSDVANPYEKLDKNNNQVNIGYISSGIEHEFNDEYSVGISLNLMAATDKEIQNFNNGNWGKEIYATLNSPYGQIIGGETYNIAALLQVSAPNFGPLGVNNSEIVDFISNPNWYRRDKKYASFKTLNSTTMNTDGVAPKISYLSPQIYNTNIGFSYIPDSYNRRGLENRFADYAEDDAYVVALYNEVDWGIFEMTTALGYGVYHDNDKDYSAGISLKRGNWSIGSGYRRTYVDGGDNPVNEENRSEKMPELFDNYREGQAWNVGVGYQFGPYKGSLSYFEAKADNTDNKDQIVMMANDFQLNKWLNIYAVAAHVKFKGENSDIYNNNKGYAFVTGLGLNF